MEGSNKHLSLLHDESAKLHCATFAPSCLLPYPHRRHHTRTRRLQVESSPKVTPTTDYYSVLGLSRDATEQEINRAWRKAVLLHHPDKRAPTSSTQASTLEQHATEAETRLTAVHIDIRLINEAKWVLSDIDRRKDWEDRFYSSDDTAPIKVDTAPHVSYDISLSAFTPHYATRNQDRAGQALGNEEITRSADSEDNEEPLYYSHPCRCSSDFVITYQDLLDGVDVVGCGGCGEWVRVGYEAVSDSED